MFQFNVYEREQKGSSESKKMRRNNKFPGVIYGKNKQEVLISLDMNKFMTIKDNPDFYRNTIDLQVGNNTHKVLVKDIHCHPVKPIIYHIDFVYA